MKGTETVMRVKTIEKGERVIMDPAITVSRVYLYFFLMTNVGSLIRSIGMVYPEKYIGFWLSFLLPTFMLCTNTYSSYLCYPNDWPRSMPDGYLCLQEALSPVSTNWITARPVHEIMETGN